MALLPLASASLLAHLPRSPESSLGLGGTRAGLAAPGPLSEPHATSQEEVSLGTWMDMPKGPDTPRAAHTHRVTATFSHRARFTALAAVKGHLVPVFPRFLSAPIYLQGFTE